MAYSFFQLTAPPLTPNAALPGIATDEATFLALIEALHDALGTFAEAHPGLTWGDTIHAAHCLAADLTAGWCADTADA